MAGQSEVVVKFLADTSGVRNAADDVKGHTSKIAGYAKVAGAALGGMFVVHEVADWVGAAEEAESVSKGLAQALGNAGDASGDWAKHAEKLAGSLMKTTGIDDEVIKKSQTILATFHNLGGQVGQTSGMFDRATKAALDMSKAGFGDADSAAKQLGKALEDPVKGITALNKSGITFTEDQKKLIKSLVESGDKAGAMGVIMDNVEGQVGGVAEATVTASDKMSVAWGETQEALGALLLPALEALAPALQTAAGWIQVTLIPAVAALFGWISDNVAPAVSDFASAVKDRLGPAFQKAADWINDKLLPALGDLAAWVRDHRDQIAGYFTPFIDAARNVIPKLVGLVVAFAVFGALVAQAVWPALKNLGEVIDHHREVIPIVAALIATAMVPALIAWATAAWAAAIGMAAAILPILGAVAVIGLVVAAIVVAGELLGGWADTWTMLGNIVTTAGGKIRDVVQTVFNWIRDNWPLLARILVFPFADAAALVVSNWDRVLGWFGNLAGWLRDRVAAIGGILFGPFGFAAGWILANWDQVVGWFGRLAGWIGSAVSGVGSALVAPFVWAAGVISAIVGGIVSIVERIVSAAQRAASAVQRIADAASGSPLPFGINIPGVPFLASGGIVRRPTLAMIGEGGPEAVVPLNRRTTMAGTVNIYVTTTGLGANSAQIQSSVADALRNYQTRNGVI